MTTYYSFLWEDFSPNAGMLHGGSFCVFSFCSISCSRVVGIDRWLMIHGCHRLHSSVCFFSVQSLQQTALLNPSLFIFIIRSLSVTCCQLLRLLDDTQPWSELHLSWQLLCFERHDSRSSVWLLVCKLPCSAARLKTSTTLCVWIRCKGLPFVSWKLLSLTC